MGQAEVMLADNICPEHVFVLNAPAAQLIERSSTLKCALPGHCRLLTAAIGQV